MVLYDPGTIEEGDPAVIRAEADELKIVAANIHTVAEMLRMVSTKGVWDSGAGTMFDSEVGTTPDDLFAIANRLSDTERIIRPYADRLESSQAVLKRKRTRYDENDKTAEERKTKLSTMTPEDPEYTTVDREYRAAANSREMNKRGYQRESEDGMADEMAMAAGLGAVGSALTDSKVYNAFEMSSRTGTSTLFNNPVVDFTPWGKPAAIVRVGDPLGKLGRRLVYGEGSYRDVGATTVLTAVDVVLPKSTSVEAKGLSRTRRRAAELRGIRAAEKSTNPIAHRRIAANIKNSATHKVATSRATAKHQAADRLAEKSGARLIDDFATDWAAVAGSGRVRKGGVAIKYSVKATNQINSSLSTARKFDDAREEAGERRRVAERKRRDARVEDLTSKPIASPIP